MPNRIIKESVRWSETLDKLSGDEERLFFRLTTVADDYGRFMADPRVVLSACFPLRQGRLRTRQVQAWLNKLVQVDLIQLYRADGKIFGHFLTWRKHQGPPRATKSRWPEPSASICVQLPADVPVSDIRSSISESDIRYPVNELLSDAGFEAFWSAWPKDRRKNKADALAAWAALSPKPELRQMILAALEAQKQTPEWNKDGGKYIPHPHRWLKKRRWEDEVGPAEPQEASRLSEKTKGNLAAAERFLARHQPKIP